MSAYLADVRAAVEAVPTRSAWDRGVTVYALELLDTWGELLASGDVAEDDVIGSPLGHKALLNGADDWAMYSDGGCALIYDGDIAERLCTPKEAERALRRRDGQANASESWLDVQARALYQAERRLIRAARTVS